MAASVRAWLLGVGVMLAMLAAPAAHGRELKVLVMGDSLSAAHGLRPQQGWVALADAKSAKYAFHNASISGETSAGGRSRIAAELARVRPDIVVIELGANDGLRGLPLAEIRANLVKLLTLVRDAKARPVLIGIELPVNYGPQYRDGLRAMYRDLATEFNVPLVPFLLDGVALEAALMQDDGLHPNAQGQPRLLDNVWSVVGKEF